MESPNGYAWYEVNGSRKTGLPRDRGDGQHDRVQQHLHPARESSSTKLWIENRESFMHFIKAARYGVNGIMTERAERTPALRHVSVAGTRSPSPPTRPGGLLQAPRHGTYSLTFSAPGYVPQTIPGVTTTWGTPTVLDVALQPELTSHFRRQRAERGAGSGLDATIAIPHPSGGDSRDHGVRERGGGRRPTR